MSHHTWNYQQALRAKGFRVTPQRELILDIICQSPNRLTAQQLCEAVRAKAPAMNPATVYRNLHFLTEQKLIRQLMHEGQVRYELAGPDSAHHHLVCRRCGQELEIPASATDAFYAKLKRDYGFAVESDHLVLYGRCRRCC